MSFATFSRLCPEVARHERKILTIAPGGDLPPGGYEFTEMYCDEESCDCRRVMFSVLAPGRSRVEAVIAWGWESLDYYQRWLELAADDGQMAKEMRGPILNLSSPQGKHAPSLLRLTREVVLRDMDYVNRLKSHYAMFREKIDHANDKEKQPHRQRAYAS